MRARMGSSWRGWGTGGVRRQGCRGCLPLLPLPLAGSAGSTQRRGCPQSLLLCGSILDSRLVFQVGEASSQRTCCFEHQSSRNRFLLTKYFTFAENTSHSYHTDALPHLLKEQRAATPSCSWGHHPLLFSVVSDVCVFCRHLDFAQRCHSVCFPLASFFHSILDGELLLSGTPLCRWT